MVHADHSAGDWNPGGETTLYLGDPIGFILEFENGFRVYAAGDTDVYGDMRYIRELYAPELALLPIGGHYTMGPRGAAIAAELLGVQHIIPIHYGTFPILTGTPDPLEPLREGSRCRSTARTGRHAELNAFSCRRQLITASAAVQRLPQACPTYWTSHRAGAPRRAGPALSPRRVPLRGTRRPGIRRPRGRSVAGGAD